MKNILLALLLTAVGLGAFAQDPPPAGDPSTTNRDDLVRRALEQHYAAQTNAPVVPDAAKPAAVAPGLAPAVNLPQFPANRLPAKRPRLGNPPPVQPLPGAAPAPAVAPPVSTAPTVLEPGAVTITTTPASAISDPDKILPPLSINFSSAPLEKVMEIYAEFVGRNLLRPEKLPDVKIVLQQTTPLTKLEIIHALEAALALNQISVVNIGDKFVTVVPTTEASKIAGRLNTNNVAELPELGAIITRVVQLKYTKPTELVVVLTPFASGAVAAPVMPIDGSGMLVLRDNVANVKRMMEMIEKVDVTMPSEFLSEVIPIKYAKAEEIASALSSVGGGTGGTVGSRPSSSGSAGAGGASRFGQPGYNPNQPGNLNQPGAANPTPSSGATFNDRLQNIIRKASSSGDIQLLGSTKIIADIRSNSLLVFATRQDMATIKDIIEKLDVVLAQVLIETLIMDVTIGDTWALGVSAAQRAATNEAGNIAGVGGYNNSQQFFNWLNSVSTNNASSALPAGFNYFAKFNETWDVALQAAAGDSRIKVVQRPRIQTSHATPATLFIGSTVPYVTSTYYGGGYGGGPSSSYQQLKVGIGLNVTPFINKEGLVVMKIEETIDELNGTTTITGVGDVPNTKSSSLSAEIAVRDGESVILGGIVRNSDNRANSGVPYLKDIPLLGALFRTSSSTKGRQESIVLMRPTVLRTPELAAQQVAVERKHMPGISEAQSTMRHDEEQAEAREAKRLQQEEKADARAAKQLQQDSLKQKDPLPTSQKKSDDPGLSLPSETGKSSSP